MAKRLVIADSAAVIEFMKSYYGDSTDGVLCQWPLFATSLQPNSDATVKERFLFDPLPGAGELSAALKANQHEKIILAFATDARGELLSWQIHGYAIQTGTGASAIQRLLPAGFSRLEIDSAIQSIAPPDPGPGKMACIRTLFDECLARHLQRLLGTDRGPENLLLRHHSLTILFLLTERQQALGLALHAQKWQIQGEVEMSGQGFPASLAKGLNLPAKGLFSDRDKALAMAKNLKSYPFEVDSVTRSPLVITPLPPYRLSELVQDASQHLGINPARAMAIVKTLYHGVVTQDGSMGLITTPSPGTQPPSAATLSALREQASILYSESSLGDPAAGLDAGMIVPLFPRLDGSSLNQSLGQDEIAIYGLIRARAIASQMKPAAGEAMAIDFLVGKEHIFQSHFHELTDPGFLAALPEQKGMWQTPCPVPGIGKGQKFAGTILCQPSGMEGQGVKPYTIESLFADLADFSIAADPVAVTLIGDLARMGYCTISAQGHVQATSQTSQVVTILGRAFPRMQGLNLAAYIEQTINEAVTGRKDLAFALKQFDQTLMLHGKILVKAKITLKPQNLRPKTAGTIIKQPSPRPNDSQPTPAAPGPSSPPLSEPTLSFVEPVMAPSPAAAPYPELTLGQPGGEDEFIIANEREGTMAEPPLAAQSERDEEEEPQHETAPAPLSPPEDLLKLFADSVAENVPETDPVELRTAAGQPQPPMDRQGGKECPACGKAMVIKQDHFGTYWGCTGFPACRHSETMAELPCPLCGQALTKKQTSASKDFFACTDNGCQFMSWSTPHYLPCGLCDSPYLVEKVVQGTAQLRCPKAGCPYAQPLPEQPAGEAPLTAPPGPKKVLVRRAVAGTGPASAGVKKVRIVRRRS